MRATVALAGLGAACALAACGFRASPAPEIAVDAGPRFCDPDDPHLIACYELEGDTRDGSSHHLDATMTHVTFPDGKAGKAMQSGADSAVDVPDTALLDVAALTVEAWIRPSQMPVLGARAGILDVDRQFGVFLHPGGLVTCGVAGILAMPQTVAPIQLDRWTHVACTFDGEDAVLYLDGIAVGGLRGNAIATNGTTGMSIAADNPPGSGSHLIGLIDQVRLLDVARSAAEICADAARDVCP